ncbi:MAG: hypothetical protein JSW08_00560 [archaeon]|nr:MAG: hypothetical protein JSW08_00560 [archaeon]
MKIQKKVILSLLVILLTISFISLSSALTVEKETVNNGIAIELDIPARYNVTLTNELVRNENFSIYSLVGVTITPEYVVVPGNSKVSFILEAIPDNPREGNYAYEFYIKGRYTEAHKDKLVMEVEPLKDIIIVGFPETVARDDKIIPLKIRNKEDIDLGTFDYKLESELFTYSDTVEFTSKSIDEKTLQVDLSEKIAGNYNITFSAVINNYSHSHQIPLILEEVSNIVTTEEKKWSFFGFKRIVTKKNEGNANKVVVTQIELPTFENGFTEYNIPPTSKEKQGRVVLVSWQRELEPGESFTIEARTDYTLLIIIIIIIAIALISYIAFFKRKVILKKKAIRLRTKGGEFAVKVILLVKNVGKELSNVKLTDRPPLSTKLYEKFGTVKPDKIEKHRIEWNFHTLLPGEEVVVSYVVYSKVGMSGVQLPEASLSFVDEKQKRKFVRSGKVYVF